MGLKINILYSGVLTASGYLFQLVTYPYISRTLGVDNIGICGFVDSIVNFFVIISMLGINTIGIREIAKCKNKPLELTKTFSELFIISFFLTIFVLFLFFLIVEFVPDLVKYRNLLYIGGLRIAMTPFIIEWFYSGIENFRYITVRSLFIKILYVSAIFWFIKAENDYIVYYGLTMGTVIVGALLNWNYKRKFVRLVFSNLSFRRHLKSFLLMGLYLLLTSLYTLFNVTYLGFVSGDTEVGYYTTATKLHSMLLALFTAFSGVMLPRISSMIANKQDNDVNGLVNQSFQILFIFSCPLIIYSMIYAPLLVEIISGKGYAGAIIPMRIIMPLMLIVGMEQILIWQILMPLKKDHYVLICSGIGALIGILANLLLVNTYNSIGSAMVWVLSEVTISIFAIYFVHKVTTLRIPYQNLFNQIIYSIPYAIICAGIYYWNNTTILTLLYSSISCMVYFFILHIFIRKDKLLFKLLFNK